MDKIVTEDCPRCLFDVARIRQNGPHLQLVCDSCGRHIRFLSKSEAKRFDSTALQPAPDVVCVRDSNLERVWEPVQPTPGPGTRLITDVQREEISDILIALEALHGGRRFNPAFAAHTDRIRRILDV